MLAITGSLTTLQPNSSIIIVLKIIYLVAKMNMKLYKTIFIFIPFYMNISFAVEMLICLIWSVVQSTR